MQPFAIVALCMFASIAYGILHDLVTARVCVEYFTVGYPPVFPTKSRTLLAIGWGIVATWWVGLMLGVPLAIAARSGRRRSRDARSLIRPICRLLAVMAASALAAGLVGYGLAEAGVIRLTGPLAGRVPIERHARFLADGAAHLASYGSGFLGGVVVIAGVWRSRRPATLIPTPASATPPTRS